MAAFLGAKRMHSHVQRCRMFVSSRSLSLMSMSPCEFANVLKKNGLRRCFLVYDDVVKEPISSHPNLLGDITDFCKNDKHDYRNHEGIFLETGKRSGALLGAFLWKTNRGQGSGGIRLLEYDSMTDFFKDGMRLSYGMGVKSALAGLWAGGGKGIIASPGHDKISNPSSRKNLFLDYGDFLSSLNGCYIGAEDVGVVVSDLDAVHERTRFVTCISEEIGGSGNPSFATGKGVVNAMEAALDYLNMGTIEGKKIVSQGCGNVSRVIIETLLDKNVGEIYASDISEEQLDFAEKLFAEKNGGRLHLEHVCWGDTEALAVPCDILSPNALGGILNEETIPLIDAKIVCGAANNQLGKDSDNKLMMDRGITYIVDFLCNRMGIANCTNEQYGRLHNDPALLQHFSRDWPDSIWNAVHNVLQSVQEKGITPVEAATLIAEQKSLEWHPIWPKRSQNMIQDLIDNKWVDGNFKGEKC